MRYVYLGVFMLLLSACSMASVSIFGHLYAIIIPPVLLLPVSIFVFIQAQKNGGIDKDVAWGMLWGSAMATIIALGLIAMMGNIQC